MVNNKNNRRDGDASTGHNVVVLEEEKDEKKTQDLRDRLIQIWVSPGKAMEPVGQPPNQGQTTHIGTLYLAHTLCRNHNCTEDS